VLVAPTVWAGERISVTGPIHFVADHAAAVEMEKGHTVVLARWNGIASHQDPAAPWNHTKVDCVGMIDALPDGGWSANGYCMHTDRDGHQWVGKWRNGSAMNGRYGFEAFKGVSGKYLGATGGGVGTCTELSQGSRGTSVCVNEGELVTQ
jgi:hypothetical protein